MIRLSCGNNCWLATFEGDAAIFAAFGTYTIPTPYTLRMERKDVIAAIQRKNPGKVVK